MAISRVWAQQARCRRSSLSASMPHGAEETIMGRWKKRPGLGWTIVAVSAVMLFFSDLSLPGVMIYGLFIAVGIMLALGPSWGQ